MSNIQTKMCFIFLLTAFFAEGQVAKLSSPDTGFLKVKHTADFEVTGDGTSAAWNKANWFGLPRRGGAGVNYQTQVKILYSATGLYCLYKCEDKKITATLQEDFADLFREDVVELFIWSDEKIPIYFEYEVSPLNYELPILVPNIKGNAFGWRPWHYEGARRTRHATNIIKKGDTIEGWTAEFFIPFALLKPMINKSPVKGTRWRANFYRIDYDKQQATWQWQLVRKTNFHDYNRFGTIVFE
ncbi:MAG: carbohydrate-binding family 9-like protein [Ferruginibacter sp.]